MIGRAAKDCPNPFQIGIHWNEAMKCHEMLLSVGNLTESEAKLLAEAVAVWLIQEKGWKARVQ
jgi:hypothetical protein